MFIFSDRRSLRPGRYKVTKDNGDSYYITLERADEPTVVGTPLNADTFSKLQSSIQSDISSAVSALQSSIKNGTVVAAKATNATSATKATQDGNGRNIINTYATLQDLDDEIELRQDLEADLRDGTIPVAKAKKLLTDMYEVRFEYSAGETHMVLQPGTIYMIVCEGCSGVFYYESNETMAYFDLESYGASYAGHVEGQTFTMYEKDTMEDYTGVAYVFPIASLGNS